VKGLGVLVIRSPVCCCVPVFSLQLKSHDSDF
jgi:hypothetical protein